ncbi:MAG: alpha-1,2-fucosyltransferase [Gallintestinimicrobium sp.]
MREAFTFRNLTLTKESAAMEQQMKECESVSVHIRRGDYLTPANQALFGGICDLDYYRRAVAEIRKRKPDVKFSCFPMIWSGRRSIFAVRNLSRWRETASRRRAGFVPDELL